jgi:c-di-GMP-binding flagellar brake protein YcgR
MERFSRLRTVLLAAMAVLAIASGVVGAETREERVRKFQGSLDEQVVRDSGKPMEGQERTAFTIQVILWVGGAVIVLVAIQQLVSRLSARRREAETVTRYLTENLMTPVAIRDHLSRVVEERIPLFVWIDDHFIKFSTHPDTLSDDRKSLVILPLTPAVGNDMLRTSKTIRVEYLYQRVPYHFECEWGGEEADRGSFVHRLALPEGISFTQRRDVYRIDPPLSSPVVCRIPGEEQPEMNVLDVSTGGFSVATSTRFKPGEEVPSFRFEGGTLLPVEGAARCIYELSLSESKSRFRYRYGFEFTRLADGCDRRIMVYTSKLQLSDLSRRREMES